MLLINNLTVDEINAALIALQKNAVTKAQSVTTTQSQSSGDNSQAIENLQNQLNYIRNSVAANSQAQDYLTRVVNELNGVVSSLTELGITSLEFDTSTRTLSLNMSSGDSFSCVISNDIVNMSLNTSTNTLTFAMGNQSVSVTLPYINVSQKGVANGVATLGSDGKVPDSQLPAGQGSDIYDAPLGTIAAYYGTTDPSDGKWLICDGRDTTGTGIELETYYPSLYIFLGNTNVLPDLREVTLVGAGQNDTDSIAAHDTYTVGQFKDDQLQNITGKIGQSGSSSGDNFLTDCGMSELVQEGALYVGSTAYRSDMSNGSGGQTEPISIDFDASRSARAGTTTHGKQKGVNYIIKAVANADTAPLPGSSIQEIESYVDNGLNNAFNSWVDMTSDFSITDLVGWGTPTHKVLYSALQRKLRLWVKSSSSMAAGADHRFCLQYNGNNAEIVFDPLTTIAVQSLCPAYLDYTSSYNGGFEPSFGIASSSKIRLGAWNRNSGNAWAVGTTLVAEISL